MLTNIIITLLILLVIIITISIKFFTKNLKLISKNKELEFKNNELHNKLTYKKESFEKDISVLSTKNEAELKILSEKNNLLHEQITSIKENKKDMVQEFKVLSQEIIDTQTTKNINSIINPFKNDLDIFKNQIYKFYTKDLEDRSMLKQELQTLKELNHTMTEETTNLTKALKGENKTMGNWGEMILEKVLEKSGLRINHEFKREVSLKNEEGVLFRPDAIVYLPNERDVIIDAKTSLVSYERFMLSGDEKDLNEHIFSLENHIKKLADKKYTKLKGVNSLDFIFMFVPIESSLTLALEHQPELFDLAYKNNIFLVSPSSLMIGLRSIENTWKHKKQEDNVKKIVNKAGSLYDKFVGFVTDIEKVSDQLNTTTKSLDLAKNKLFEGKGNLVGQIEQLRDMGANNSKNLKNL